MTRMQTAYQTCLLQSQLRVRRSRLMTKLKRKPVDLGQDQVQGHTVVLKVESYLECLTLRSLGLEIMMC
jgi:hypothetical protein